MMEDSYNVDSGFFNYEIPKLEPLSTDMNLIGVCQVGSGNATSCGVGNSAGGACSAGNNID